MSPRQPRSRMSVVSDSRRRHRRSKFQYCRIGRTQRRSDYHPGRSGHHCHSAKTQLTSGVPGAGLSKRDPRRARCWDRSGHERRPADLPCWRWQERWRPRRQHSAAPGRRPKQDAPQPEQSAAVRGENNFLPIGGPGKTSQEPAVGSQTTRLATAGRYNKNVTSEETCSGDIGEQFAIWRESRIGEIRIWRGHHRPLSAVLHREKKNAGARVLRRHSVRDNQIPAVRRPVHTSAKSVASHVCFGNLACGSPQGGDDVVISLGAG